MRGIGTGENSDRKHLIQLAHGGGGRMMRKLIDELFAKAFASDVSDAESDAAILNVPHKKIAYTTDSYVVDPLIFPGGDIGTLAVNGTVNDLSMRGARPLYLSAGFILEEGLPLEILEQIVQSMKQAAETAGVKIVTGDTKVVDRGHGHGIFINTSGIGIIEHDLNIAPSSVQEGDVIILNGDVGRHGIAVMAKREELALETAIESDCASLAEDVQRLLAAGIEIHCMRDLTRGGLATALAEIAQSSRKPIEIEETAVPILEPVMSVCEILGFDPFYVANEGRFIAFVPEKDSPAVLDMLKRSSVCETPSIIGRVVPGKSPFVTLRTALGTTRVLDLLSGEQLPRIC